MGSSAYIVYLSHTCSSLIPVLESGLPVPDGTSA